MCAKVDTASRRANPDNMIGPTKGPAPNALARRGLWIPLLVAAAFVAASTEGAVAGPDILIGPSPPRFLYTPALIDPGACICLPPYMLQDPSAVHLWWAKAAGGADLRVTPIAVSVNAAESSMLHFRLLAPSGSVVASADVPNVGPAGTSMEGPVLTAASPTAGDLYRIDVSLSSVPGLPAARHYRLRVDGSSIMGAPSPLYAQAEADDARWTINVAPGETPQVIVRSGPEAGATAGVAFLIDPSGTPRVVGPINVGLFSGLSIAGSWTVHVVGANGHYYLNKTGGLDRGVYLRAGAWGFGTIDVSILSGGVPNTLPVQVDVISLPSGTIQSFPGVTSGLAVERLALGSYRIQIIPPPGIPAPAARTFDLDCDEVAYALFDLGIPPPVANAGPDQGRPEGSTVMLDGTASFSPTGGSLTYLWSVLSSTSPAPPALSDPTAATPMFFAPDDDTIVLRLTVRNELGQLATDEVTVNVFNVAPSADAGGPYSAPWGAPIAFTGTAQDPGPLDAPSLSATWTFGDGGSAGGFQPTHAYATTGNYTVALDVSDGDGGHGADLAVATVLRRPTAIAYTGDLEATSGEPLTLAAALSDLIDVTTQRLAGVTLTITVGPTSYTLAADASGEAMTAITLPTGTYPITVSFAGNADYGPAVAAATLVVSPPGSDAGKVTGGGMRFANDGRGGFNVKSNGEKVKGELQFKTKETKFHAHTITFLEVANDCRSARFAGVGKDGRSFEAYVEDNGKGRVDVFRLTIDGSPANGDGTVLKGNIKIHC